MSCNIVDSAPVCVIIAAHNAAGTIGEAVTSALGEPEVGELVLVDDASQDGTPEVAFDAAAGDRRLQVLRQAENAGPAAARNAAIAVTTAPFIAVLDADDVLLPGRFRALLGLGDWDFLADNILFAAEDLEGRLPHHLDRRDMPQATPLSLAEFTRGSLARGFRKRGELGFLKPMMRRAFLEQHGLRYDSALRLGEDFDLYTWALLCGARFGVTQGLGYVARVRANSLSASHKTADLAALCDACERHVAAAPDQPELREHLRQIRQRYVLRAFLDMKSDIGAGAAMRFAVSPPQNLPVIVSGVLRDKLNALWPRHEASPVGQTLL